MHSCTATELHRFVADIWTTMLGLTLAPADYLATHAASHDVVTGMVQLSGDWSGAVAVTMRPALAYRVAGLMFGSDAAAIDQAELHDTVGELANMTGGGVKSMLTGDCQLSLPSVTTRRDYHDHVPGARVVERATADCEGELVVITLLEYRS